MSEDTRTTSVATDSDQAAASDQKTAKANQRPDYAKNVQRGPGPMGAQVHEKAMNFWPSLKRLLGHLAPERVRLVFVILLAIVGVVMSVVGPKILGRATDVLFAGILGRQLGD